MKQLIVTASLCLLFCVSYVNSDGLSVLPNPVLEESEELAFEKLSKIEAILLASLQGVIKQALPIMIRASSAIDLNPECMGSILKLLSGVKDLKLWAIKMLDSNGIPAGGMLRGKGASLGSYKQCIDIEIPTSAFSKVDQTVGQFCVARFRPPLPPRPKTIGVYDNMFRNINATFKTEALNEIARILFIFYDTPFKLGLCLPSTCSKEEISDVLQTITSVVGLNSDIDFCVTKEPFNLDTVQKSILGFYLAIILINILATVWDEIPKQEDKHNGNIQKAFKAFSIRRNITALVSTKAAVDRSLDCMNGMRFISITWVLLGHAYFTVERNLLRESILLIDYIGDFSFQAIANAYVTVETFFFISSVLVAYNLVRYVDTGKAFPIFTTIVLRILRLLPSMLLVISIIIILPAFGDGPLFKDFMVDQANLCREKWWQNALFYGNADSITSLCLAHGWYISTEFQCFLFSMLYFLLLFKNQNWANIFLVATIIACVLSSGLVTYILDLTPSVLAKTIIDVRYSVSYSKNVYMLPHVHVGIYAVGLFLGTYLARNPKVKVSIWTTVIGWPVAFAGAVALLYATYPWNKGDHYSQVESVIYSAFQRTAWGLCMAWVVLACYAQKGGIINTFLSWSAFQPLVRLSYLVYLVHQPINFFLSSSKLGSSDATHYVYVINFLGVLCGSHIIAFFIRILFESPVTQIVALFFRWRNSWGQARAENDRETTKC